MNSVTRITLLTGISLAIVSAPAVAQQAPPDESDAASEPGEIVVTAQKRTERLQDVPQSISVASQKQLESQQINAVSDLSRIAPSLEIQQAPGQSVGGGGQVRGIGTQSFQAGAVGSVGLVVDQVSQGNVNISDLFDVARVEVLKGPQGTLFGLTTSAGVINITTNAPVFNEFSGRVRTELSKDGVAGSNFGRQIIQGVVNVPISSNAAFRLAGNINLTQGVNRSTATGKLDTHNTYGLRGRFLWEPTDNLTVNLIGDYSSTTNRGQDFFVIQRATPDLAAALASCGVVAGDGNRDYCFDEQSPSTNQNYGGSAQVDYDAGPFTITSITAYREQLTGPTSATGTIFRVPNPVPPNLQVYTGPSQGGRSSLFTQELRIASPNESRIEYTAGLFYSSQRTLNRPSNFAIIIQAPFPPPPHPVQVAGGPGSTTKIRGESFAVFGQATFHVDDHFSLIAGGRYTTEKLAVDTFDITGVQTNTAETSLDNFSWRLGLQYEFNRDLMAYATVSRGYKGPQIALRNVTDPTSVNRVIRPEIPMNYEIGMKGILLDGNLSFDLSAFYMDLKDYQAQECQPNPSGGLTCSPKNISKLVSKGVEFNVSARPVQGLNLNAGIIYNSVKYPAGYQGSGTTFVSTPAPPFMARAAANIGGLQLLGVPEWKFTASGEYSHPISGSVDGFIGFDAIHKSALRLAASTDPLIIHPPSWTLGGRVGIRGPEGAWSVAIFARNLTNNHEPIIRYQDFPDGNFGAYAQILTPQAFRQVGISADVRF